MSETAVLLGVVGALWGLVLTLVGVVWTTLKERIAAHDTTIKALDAQNTAQEVQLGRLIEMARAREDAHAQHREDMAGAVGRLEASIAELGRKLDRMAGQGTPYPRPGQYRQEPGDSGEKGR